MTKNMLKIGIIGDGVWGTALGCVVAQSAFQVTLISINKDIVTEINQHHSNTLRLPGITLPENIIATMDWESLVYADCIIIVVPSQQMRKVGQILQDLSLKNPIILIASKGIEISTGLFMSEVLKECGLITRPIGILSGPNFAREVALGLPSATGIFIEKNAWPLMHSIFNSDVFSISLHTDIIGAQICGALKNVYAIASGILMGLGAGENIRAALISLALQELQSIGQRYQADPSTFSTITGIGDLLLTCMGGQSRNFKFGCFLGSGGTSMQYEKKFPNSTVEGYATTLSIVERLQSEIKNFTLLECIHEILYKHSSPQNLIRCILRINKDEHC